MVELKELAGETGGGSSGEGLGRCGGGTGGSTDFTSILDADTGTFSENGRVSPGRFGGTGWGNLWMWELLGAFNNVVAWGGVGSGPKFSAQASGRELGGGRGGKDGCEGWTGGGGAFRKFERGFGEDDLTAGCLGGGGARVLFLTSDMVEVKGGRSLHLGLGLHQRFQLQAFRSSRHHGSKDQNRSSRSSPSQPREARVPPLASSVSARSSLKYFIFPG